MDLNAIEMVVGALSPIGGVEYISIQTIITILPFVIKILIQFYAFNDSQRINIVVEAFQAALQNYNGENKTELIDFVQSALPSILNLLLKEYPLIYKWWEYILLKCGCRHEQQHKLAIKRVVLS